MQIAIIKNGLVDNVIEVDPVEVDGVQLSAIDHASQLLPDAHVVPLPEGAVIGWIYTSEGAFLPPQDIEPQAARLRIVITSVSPDEVHRAGTQVDLARAEVTCLEGTRLAVTAELRIGAAVVPEAGQFRLPLRATDGRERVLLASMTAGVITINATLRDSGIWRVDEAGINSAMPPGQGFVFDGLTVYVLQD